MNKNYFLTSFMFKNKMYPYEQFSRSMAWFIFTGLFTIYTSLAAYEHKCLMSQSHDSSSGLLDK